MTRSELRAKLWAALALALLVAASLEVGLRIYHKIAYGTSITSLTVGYQPDLFPLSPFLVFGPRLDYQIEDRQHSEQAYFDSLGFRTNEPVVPKRSGEFRIVAVGGSTTENIWNREGLHWPLALECRLRDAGYPHVRVLNSAMSAYTTAHSLVRLQFDLLEYEPDMVIVMHNVNDLMVTYEAHRRGLQVDGHYQAKFGAREFTGEAANEFVPVRLWRAVRTRWEPRPEPPPMEGYDLAPGLRYFSRNLGHIADLARAKGVAVVFLTMPFDPARVEGMELRPGEAGLGGLPSPERFAADMRAFNEAIEGLGDESNVTVVDMASELEGDESAFVDAAHYTGSGIRRFGEVLARHLQDAVPDPPESYALSAAALRRCDW